MLDRLRFLLYPSRLTEQDRRRVDENLIRNELSVLERGEHLVRRKQLHEQLHPESKQGGAPGKKGGGKAKTTESVGFVKNTATTMGRGEVTVREEVRIGNLPQQVRNLARGTLLANQKGRLLSLAKLKGKEQMAEARRLARGKPKRAVRKAKPEEATTVETPAVTVEPTVSTMPAMQPSTAAPIGSTEPSSAREGKDALRARRKLAELLDVSGYPPAEQAAKMLAKVAPLLQVAIGRAPEMNRPSLETIMQSVQQCAGLLEEHHVLRQSCSCNGSPDCTWCGGKGWLSWADQRRLSGQAQGVA